MNSDLEQLAARWAAMQSGDRQHDEAEVAIICAVDDLIEHSEDLWRFILLALPMCAAEPAKGMLAAGPLEDLLQEHGAQFIDRVEQLAQAEPAFAALLAGVWLPAAQDAVTLRYLALGCDQVRPLA
ncbi:DUF6869 domain-containing protein [Cognatilysobacter terrigena]|uniref:DUF6869 domain-containing protein n=1 Tax=Cognatilysobacter terrigena TaxID=2488749 RepID=UPI00105DFFB0|nr:hypothetical protein [Lysobacter terrigena]